MEDETTVDVAAEQTTDEVAKMLSVATQKAVEAGAKANEAALEKATESVGKFFDAVSAKAVAGTSKVVLQDQKTASFDADQVLKDASALLRSKGSVGFTFKSESELDYLAKGTDRTDLTGVVIEPDKDVEISRPALRNTFVEQIANVVPTTSDSVKYTEVLTTTGAPATTAEAAAIPEVDRTFGIVSVPLQKIAGISKHSNELLKYGAELVAVLKDMLAVDLNLIVDGQLLSGNGTAPNLQGVLGVAEVLDSAAIGAQVVPNANLFDVLRIAMTKIATAGKGKYVANYIVLNPTDAEELDLTKNANGDYIMPSFVAAGGQTIKGARVIENTGITAGSFLIGDFRYLNVRPNGGVEVDFSNSDGTDFAKGIVAIRMQRYLAAYVKNNDSAAFMTGDISDVKGYLAA
ncbi:phage major capsid protein [Novosphingobium aquae]|uniref:Phage major capsid protein n=1 Tax=Novosphingobium aquae TaxID=3133435 RepID=A0ABU8SBT3_9SPHN